MTQLMLKAGNVFEVVHLIFLVHKSYNSNHTEEVGGYLPLSLPDPNRLACTMQLIIHLCKYCVL